MCAPMLNLFPERIPLNMDTSVILNQMIILFIMIFIGYFLFKAGIITPEFNRLLTKLILNLTMPCLILNSVLQSSGDRNYKTVLLVFGIAIAMYIILPIISTIIIKLFHFPKPQQELYIFMMIFSNVGFMGFPLIAAVYGDGAVFYTAIFNIIFNLSSFTFGIWLISHGTSIKITFTVKRLLTPGVIFSLLAIVLYFLNINLPQVIVSPINSIGAMTTPLAMLVIGSTLATMKIRDIFNDWHVYPFALIKQIMLPFLLYPVIHYFITDDLILGITFIMLLVPVANTSVLFATEYGNDEQLAAKNVFITTLLSVITVPLMVYLCMK